jgi:hypothetical protein
MGSCKNTHGYLYESILKFYLHLLNFCYVQNCSLHQDLYNIPRECVSVDWKLKLGSGASGAHVYKGQFVGDAPILNVLKAHHSILTNIRQRSDCAVAVKVLPETATHSQRRQFLSEINLLKVRYI